MMGLDVDGQGGVLAHCEGAWCQLGTAEEVDLVRQADTHQRTARTLGAVLQRRWELSAGGNQAQAVDGVVRGAAQLLVEQDRDPLATGGIIEHPLLATIAVLAQDHALDAELDALRLVGTARHVRALAALVVDRGHLIAFSLDQIHLGNEPESVGRKGDGTGVDTFLLLRLLRFGQLAPGLIHPPVDVTALHRVAGVLPFPLHPLQIGQARTILVLIDHARRQQRQVPAELRERQGELGLLRGRSWCTSSILC